MKFLLEEASSGTGISQWILPAVLLVLIVGIFIMNYFRSKTNRENMQNMVNSIKVGDKVKTYSGFYGTIVEITETTDGKVAVLETGNDKSHGYISIDMNAIYAIDNKKPIVLDENGNIIDQEENIQEEKKEVENNQEIKIENTVEEEKTEEKVEEKINKKRTKKTSKKEEN